MTVINPSSISGITSITMPSGDGNVLTIHTNDGVERFRIDSSGNVKVGSACTISQDGDVFFTGVTTATTFTGAHSGSGANLTSLPAAQLTGALPAISGANLTGIAATDNVRTGILDVAGIATFRNDVNVGAAVTISESGIEASGIGITCANINGGAIGGRRNLIINGDMRIAQRGTSSTVAEGYGSCDRFKSNNANNDEAPTQSQVDVASGTTPYSLGFRKAFRMTNGNQTGGAGTGDRVCIIYQFEGQDIANSGWNYTSASSFITISYWVKSSVAQNFYVQLRARDGTEQGFTFETGSLSADTWTKVTKTVPGNSNLQFDDDNTAGLLMEWNIFRGTAKTGSMSLDTWAAFDGNTRTPDQTSTWYTTNDATFEITGVQFEVGSQATAFEHRSRGEELQLCQRYFQKTFDDGVTPAVSVSKCIYMFTRPYTSGYHEALGNDYIVEMRSQPSMTFYPIQGSGSAGQVSYYDSGWSNTSASYHTSHSNNKRLVFSINTSSSTTLVQYNYTADAEL